MNTARTPARQTRTDLARTAPGLVKDARSTDESAAGSFTWKDETYRISDEQGIWPLLQFARAAEAGFRVTDARGLAAVHAFLQDMIHPDDWPQFQEDMISKKEVDLEGLLKTVQEAVSKTLDKMAAAGQITDPGGEGK